MCAVLGYDDIARKVLDFTGVRWGGRRGRRHRCEGEGKSSGTLDIAFGRIGCIELMMFAGISLGPLEVGCRDRDG